VQATYILKEMLTVMIGTWIVPRANGCTGTNSDCAMENLRLFCDPFSSIYPLIAMNLKYACFIIQRKMATILFSINIYTLTAVNSRNLVIQFVLLGALAAQQRL